MSVRCVPSGAPASRKPCFLHAVGWRSAPPSERLPPAPWARQLTFVLCVFGQRGLCCDPSFLPCLHVKEGKMEEMCQPRGWRMTGFGKVPDGDHPVVSARSPGPCIPLGSLHPPRGASPWILVGESEGVSGMAREARRPENPHGPGSEDGGCLPLRRRMRGHFAALGKCLPPSSCHLFGLMLQGAGFKAASPRRFTPGHPAV